MLIATLTEEEFEKFTSSDCSEERDRIFAVFQKKAREAGRQLVMSASCRVCFSIYRISGVVHLTAETRFDPSIN